MADELARIDGQLSSLSSMLSEWHKTGECTRTPQGLYTEIDALLARRHQIAPGEMAHADDVAGTLDWGEADTGQAAA